MVGETLNRILSMVFFFNFNFNMYYTATKAAYLYIISLIYRSWVFYMTNLYIFLSLSYKAMQRPPS